MKNFVRFGNRICRAFTLAAMLLLVVNWLGNTDAAQSAYLRVSSFLLLFPVTVLYAAATELFLYPKIAFGLRLSLHCAIVCGSVWGILYMPVSSSAGSAKLGMLLIVLLVYWLFMGVCLIARGQVMKEQKKRKEPVYQNRFSNK